MDDLSKEFIRRSFLYTPGSSSKMIAKAWETKADSIIFDLEDAVILSEKGKARENVINSIKENKQMDKEVIVRVNAMNSIYGIWDILGVAEKQPDALIIPKADENSMIVADALLEAIEEELGLKKGGIKLIPLLETTYGMINVYRILNSSSRINGVQLGAEDLTKEQGIERTREGEEIRYARGILAYAACSCGIDIIDTPFTGIKDIEGLESDTKMAKSIGFTGKTCIHPSHVETINMIFSPREEAVLHAKRLLETFDEAIKEGKGACMYEGKMIDNPIAERARKIIEKANIINSI